MIDAFPIFFSSRDTVTGNGFVAQVHVSGRAIMYEEDGRWWMVGVEPGGMAAAGETQAEAYMAFREAVRKVLHDSTHLFDNFDAFRDDVNALMSQVDTNEDSRWQAARAAIRAGASMPAEGFVGELPRPTADPQIGVAIRPIEIAQARPEPCPSTEVQAAA